MRMLIHDIGSVSKPLGWLGQRLGLIGSVMLAIAPSAFANPGWEDWQKITGSNQPLPHTAGFSNIELGGYLEYEDRCAQAAAAAQEQFTYWYRLSDLVWEIGTGEVENKCQEGDEVVATYNSTSVLREINEPYCLRVNTDIGNGLRVRRESTITAQQIDFLPNGTKIFPDLPASITADHTGRQWLWIPDEQQPGWASISAGAGEYVNFQLCSAD